MKSIKILFVFIATLFVLSVHSQSLNANLYGSTGKTNIFGGDLYVTTPVGFIFGVGGSHATKTFFNSELKDGNDFRDMNKNNAPNPPGVSGMNQFSSFVENRGTVSGLIGYSFNEKRTSILCDLGIGFKQNISLLTSAPLNTNNQYPHGTLGYLTSSSSAFTYGGTIVQSFKGRLGIMAGYNNLQKFKLGINYRITPTKMFNW